MAGTMEQALQGKRVAVLATDGVEQIELTEPVKALKAAGAEVVLIGLEAGSIQGMNHDEKGDRFPVDKAIADVTSKGFAGLVLPGGVANPDKLRTNELAVAFVREFMESDKPVAAICHGPWLLVEAGVLKGRTITSWPSLKTDIRNAGGEWVDKPVQVDQKLVTSRKPDDLSVFCTKMISTFSASSAEHTEGKLDRMVEQSFPASDPLPGPSTIGKGKSGESTAPAH
jgi:protease I